MLRKLALTFVALVAAIAAFAAGPGAAQAGPPIGYRPYQQPTFIPPYVGSWGFGWNSGYGMGNGFGQGHRHSHRHFDVLVRHRYHWDVYRTYRDYDDAQRAAFHLRRQGYQVRIDRN